MFRCHRAQHVRSRACSRVGGDLLALDCAYARQERRMTITSGHLKYQLMDQIESRIKDQIDDMTINKYDSFSKSCKLFPSVLNFSLNVGLQLTECLKGFSIRAY